MARHKQSTKQATGSKGQQTKGKKSPPTNQDKGLPKLDPKTKGKAPPVDPSKNSAKTDPKTSASSASGSSSNSDSSQEDLQIKELSIIKKLKDSSTDYSGMWCKKNGPWGRWAWGHKTTISIVTMSLHKKREWPIPRIVGTFDNSRGM